MEGSRRLRGIAPLASIAIICALTYAVSCDASPDRSDGTGAPERQLAEDQGAEKRLAGLCIALSAGHGLRYDETDSAWKYEREEHGGLREDIFTQDFTIDYLKPALEAEGAYVICLRCPDRTIIGESGGPRWKENALSYLRSLGETQIAENFSDVTARPQYAIKREADLFLSIHANSLDGLKRGSHVFLYGEEYRRVSPDSYPMERSLALAQEIAQRMYAAGKALDPAWTDYGMWQYDLGELREYSAIFDRTGAETPAVMVYPGWIDNELDRVQIASPDFLAACAAGIRDAIIACRAE